MHITIYKYNMWLYKYNEGSQPLLSLNLSIYTIITLMPIYYLYTPSTYVNYLYMNNNIIYKLFIHGYPL